MSINIKPEWKKELGKLRKKLQYGESETMTQEEIDRIVQQWEPRVNPPDKEKEIFALVNSQGRLRGVTAPRWLCHLLGLRHRCAHVLLRWKSPTLGSLLILQIRDWKKTDSPGHLDISVGGHVRGNESCEGTAYEEMEQELGITKQEIKYGRLIRVGGYASYNKRPEDSFYNAEWREVYTAELVPEGIKKLRFQDKEVVGLYLCPESGAEALLKQNIIPIASALGLSLPIYLEWNRKRKRSGSRSAVKL